MLGTLAFAVVAWWTRVRFGIDGEVALLWGWMGSAAAGSILAVAARSAVGEPEPRRRGRPGRPVPIVIAGAAIALVLAGLVRSGVTRQTNDKATRYTRADAEELGRTLVDSDAHTANDLALTAANNGPGRQVVWAEGDRDTDGAVLVVRITWSAYGSDDVSRCWRYQLHNSPEDHLPTPVGCPDAPSEVNLTTGLGQYSYGLYNELRQLPPEESDDLDAIRGAVVEMVDFYIASSGTDIEVERLGDGLVGVAVRVGLTDCVITRIDTEDREAANETWRPDPALLRSDHPGCVPALARSNPNIAPEATP